MKFRKILGNLPSTEQAVKKEEKKLSTVDSISILQVLPASIIE